MTAAVWRRRGDALWRRTTEAVVVLPRDGDEPLVLGGAAALLWDVLEDASSFEEAVDLLARACGVPPEEVRAELEPVVEMLLGAGAIEVYTAC